MPKAPRARKQFGNSGSFGLETGRFAGKSAQDIANSMGLGDPDSVVTIAKSSENSSNFTVNPVSILSQNYGIQVKMSNSGISYSGELWNLIPDDVKATITSPSDLIRLLGGETSIPNEYKLIVEEPQVGMYDDIPPIMSDELDPERVDVPELGASATIQNEVPIDNDIMNLFQKALDATQNQANKLNDDCA